MLPVLPAGRALLFPQAGAALNCEEIYVPVEGGQVVYDPECTRWASGCNAGGHVCCRVCDAEGYMTCADNTVPFE